MSSPRPVELQWLEHARWCAEPAFTSLLGLAADPPDAARLQGLVQHCAQLHLLGAFASPGELVGLAAYRRRPGQCVELEYLAVLPQAQHRQVASALVQALRTAEQATVVAATDDDAIGFYRARGFLVSRAPRDQRWPAATRYWCTLAHPAALRQRPTGDPQLQYLDGAPAPGSIQVVPADPGWAQHFEQLAERLRRALGATAQVVEHVGSTSVPALAAKPVIDINLLVDDPRDEDSYVPQLRAAGLLFWLREPGWHQHRLFKQLATGSTLEANIHLFALGSAEHCRMVLLRDRLRSDPAVRRAYARAKLDAAGQLNERTAHQGLVMDYNRIKEPFILGLLEQIVHGFPEDSLPTTA